MPIVNALGVVITREIDLSLFVEAFSPTVFALVGTMQTGPVNKGTLTTTPLQWMTTFGDPVSSAGFAAMHFLRTGTQLLTVRVVPTTPAWTPPPKPSATVQGGEAQAAVVSSNVGPFQIDASYASHQGTQLGPFDLHEERKASWTGGGNAFGNLAALQAITDGHLNLTLDGVTAQLIGLDFTGLSFAAIADLIETTVAGTVAFGTSTVTVTPPAASGQAFKIESELLTSTGAVNAAPSVTVGTDIYALLGGTNSNTVVTYAAKNNRLAIEVVSTVDPTAESLAIDLPTGAAVTTGAVADAINAAGDHVNATAQAVPGGTVLKLTHDQVGSDNTFELTNPTGSALAKLGLTAAVYAGTESTNKLDLTFTNITAASGTVNVVLPAGSNDADVLVDAINDAIVAAADPDPAWGTAEVLNTSTGQRIRIATVDAGASATIEVLGSSTANDSIGFDVGVFEGADPGDDTLIFSERYPGYTGIEVRLFRGTNFIASENEVFKVQVYQRGVIVSAYDNVRKTAASAAEEAFLFEAVIGNTDTPRDPFIVVEDLASGGNPVITDVQHGDSYPLTSTNGDPSGLIVSDGDIIGDLLPTPSGLQVFRDSETFDATLLAAPGYSSDLVIGELIDIAETRQDLLALIDAPPGYSVQDVADWHNAAGGFAAGRTALNSSYAALFYPWVNAFNPITNVLVPTAPSGHAAQVIAYSDRQSNPWFSPAGLNRGRLFSARSLEVNVTEGQRDFLQGNLNRVNTFVSFLRDGIVLMSDLTLLRASSALASIPVRRMLMVARKAIKAACRQLLFEPNDPISWRRFVTTVNPFLSGIMQGRGLEAFGVIMDATTVTPELRARQEARGIIYLVPTSTMKKIFVDFVIKPSGTVSFGDIREIAF